MPVDKDINLDAPEGITEEDIRKMNEEADELERIAENAEKNADRIDKAKSKLDNMTFADKNILDKSLDAENLVSEGHMSREEMAKMMVEIKNDLEETKKKAKENSKKISEEEKKRKEEIKKLKKQESEINEVHGAIEGIRNNPFGFGRSKAMGLVGKAGIWGMVAQFAVDMAQQVYEDVLNEVKKQFGAGGAWDKRKLVLDVVNEYNSINYLTRVRSGGVIFTADAGQDLRQGAPNGAYNTRDLRDGHVRYLQFHYNE